MARYPPYFHFLTCTTLSLLCTSCVSHEYGKAMKQNHNFKGMFVFGTSVVDNGNNNFINDTIAKVDYLPYGLDFPYGPTGRFSNGKNVADLIGDLLGLPLIPPFADPRTKGDKILYGVNYGSGGSGILDETGNIAGEVINLKQQINNFEHVTLLELKTLLERNFPHLLDQYLFLLAEGNNDFSLNYFLQDSSSRPSLPVFVAQLTSTYASHLQTLYKAGARKFVLLKVYPLGCSPAIKQQANSQRCVQKVNKAVHYFNTQLISMVDDLKQKLPGSNFVVVNTYKIIRDIIKNPMAGGLRNTTGPCCELETFLRVGISCIEEGKVCKERNKYVYFDGQHNTEAVNSVIAAKAFFSDRKTEVYPFNLQSLTCL